MIELFEKMVALDSSDEVARKKMTFNDYRLEVLRDIKLSVVDVGAAVCLMEHWEKFKYFADIYAIEPDVAACEKLAEKYKKFPNYKIIQKPISEKGGICELNVLFTPTGSSLLEPNPSYLYRDDARNEYPIKKIELQTTTLNELIANDIKNSMDAIKIDIQGYEYFILRSLSPENVDNLLLIEMETGSKVYKNQPKFVDVEMFMELNNFELYDIRVARTCLPKRRIKTDLSQYKIANDSPKVSAKYHEMDVVYFKSIDYILGKNSSTLVIKMITLLCVYNFFYEATYLAEQAFEAGIIDSLEQDQLIKYVWGWYETMEQELIYMDTPKSNLVREFLWQFQLKNAPSWHRYMTQGYPS